MICLSVILYADDILLLAPSVNALQKILHVCEKELDWLYLTVNVSKSSCMRMGPRFKAWAPARGGQGGRLPTLEKIRVSS